MKLYLEPRFDQPDTGEGGIRRIVEAQRKYLPALGVEIVDDINQADLTAGHGGALPLRAGLPFACHSHGLYWSNYRWTHGETVANRRVIDCLLCADAITVPSEYVRGSYVRGVLRRPTVVYHGIEPDQWPRQDPGGYVLWNKPREDAVCDVQDLMTLVKKMPNTSFVSTLGVTMPNLKLVGRMGYPAMKSIIQRASVYLTLAQETFGIGTLEALASGVPVAGWNYGGQREIIKQGETGYLAPKGDYAALGDCIRRCEMERARLSANAIEDARTRWSWPDKIEKYARVYRQVLAGKNAKPQVSVIVPCHNLGRFLEEALESVAAQTYRDWECIIVDDASTDETPKIAAEWTNDPQFFYVRSDENLKLSRARNFGFDHACGRYVTFLDADDLLTPKALEIQVKALDKNPHLHIAYGSLDVMGPDGTGRRSNPFPRQFNYLEQMAHLNQLHYAALMRRSVWEETGGNRERLWRAEDAETWCRATSFGFRAAKVTEEPTVVWRFRPDGKSAQERQAYADVDGDWTADFPWAIAHNMHEGRAKKEANALVLPNFNSLPFGAPVKDAPIWNREDPLVSIVIPLGPGHERYVIDALDSCVAQTFTDWEVIVVDDTGHGLKEIAGAPYARIFHTEGQRGPARARNLGLTQARGKLVLWLDADDQLAPDCLMAMLKRYAQGEGNYVYSGWRVLRADGQVIEFPDAPYNRQDWLIGAGRGRHTVSTLMAVGDAKLVPFDETLAAYEDWDYFCQCAVKGLCGVPASGLLVTYRQHVDGRSVTSGKPNHEALVKEIHRRYDEYARGTREMGKCGSCPNKAHQEAVDAARASIARQESPAMLGTQARVNVAKTAPVATGKTRMRFVGPRVGPVTYYVKGRPYTGANADENRFVDAIDEDVQALENMGVWRREKIQPPPPSVASQVPPAARPMLAETPPPPPPVEEPRLSEPVKVQAVAPTVDKTEVVAPPGRSPGSGEKVQPVVIPAQARPRRPRKPRAKAL